MGKRIWVVAIVLALCGLTVCIPPILARAPSSAASATPQITDPINDNDVVAVPGNIRPEATAANDRGQVPDGFPLNHLLLLLRRSPQRERKLEQLIDQLEDPNSPNYHHWLTAQQFGQRFGASPQDIDTIATWLRAHGFRVNYIYPSATLIDFSGTAGSVRDAFHTEIHSLSVNGKNHFANMSDPSIPAALAPALEGVVSLNDFRPHPLYRRLADYTLGSNYELVVPADLATIYDLNPLFAAGYSGTGQTIVTVEDTDLYSTANWTTFRSVLGLSGYGVGLPGADSSGAGNRRHLRRIPESTVTTPKRRSMWSGPVPRRPTRRSNWRHARTPRTSADLSRCRICSVNPARRLRL